jgi:glycine/D-amino acid oxidase-like deaminating enzyme
MVPTARLDVRQYLERSQAYFEHQGRLVRGRHPGDPPGRGDFTIDAQGFTAELRFPRVRFAASRGEILTLRLPGVTESRTLNRLGTWLTPLQPEIYRVGSTYDRDHLFAGPTDTGAATILAKLALFYRGDYEILDHQAAVRPIIRTSQPVVGSHPDDPTLWFINGFGSKGSLLAPWVCEQLIASMLEGRPLDPELDLSFYQPPRRRETDADHGTSP